MFEPWVPFAKLPSSSAQLAAKGAIAGNGDANVTSQVEMRTD
jgi:hypothetical protein